MSEMVERVAERLFEAIGHDAYREFGKGTGNWSLVDNQQRDFCRLMARAAIEAMREPTREMATAAYDKLDWGYPDGVDADFVRAWREMIDAALATETVS